MSRKAIFVPAALSLAVASSFFVGCSQENSQSAVDSKKWSTAWTAGRELLAALEQGDVQTDEAACRLKLSQTTSGIAQLAVPFESDDGYSSTGIYSSFNSNSKAGVAGEKGEGHIVVFERSYRIFQNFLGFPAGANTKHSERVAAKFDADGNVTGFALASVDISSDRKEKKEDAILCGISAEELADPALAQFSKGIDSELQQLSDETVAEKNAAVGK